MSDAIESQDTFVYIGAGDATSVAAGSDTFTEWKEVKNISGIGGGEATEIDVTHLRSTGKEFRMGMADGGSVTMSFNIVPGDAGQVSARAARAARMLRHFRFILSDGTVLLCTAYVMTFERGMAVDGVVEGSATLRLSGIETES